MVAELPGRQCCLKRMPQPCKLRKVGLGDGDSACEPLLSRGSTWWKAGLSGQLRGQGARGQGDLTSSQPREQKPEACDGLRIVPERGRG